MFIKTHIPCNSCDSSDGMSLNEDGSTYCFVCNGYTKEGNMKEVVVEKKPASMKFIQHIKDGTSVSVSDRRITRASMDKYGVVVDEGSYYFPYTSNDGEVVAAKVRNVKEKEFHTEGKWTDATLFGQQLFSKGGKYITITEGEFDCLAAFQMLGSKYPVVSIRNGAASATKDCQSNYEYLNSFDNIVICFDGDVPGKEAAKKVAELFGNKAKVFKPDPEYKDACEWSASSKEAGFVQRWWSAESFVPDGIVRGSTLWDLVSQPMAKADCSYPWAGLDELTYGIRLGELVTVTAGSGLGKSQTMREIVWHILQNTKDNIGLMFLEESVRKTSISMLSLAANAPLHLPDVVISEEERRRAFNETLGTDRIFFFDHFGSTSIENIVNRVRYFAKAFECKYVFLDHLSIIVSSQDNGDERKAIDEIMTSLRTLVQETNIALLLVSHLKRPVDKGHEEGAVTSLAQLRGSASIAQLSDMVIGLERNGQAEDEQTRNTTKIRVLKNRFSGTTGPAGNLLYNKHTGRMLEIAPTQEEAL